MPDDAAASPAAPAPADEAPGHRVPEGAGAPDLGIVDSLVQLSFLVQGVLARVAAEHGVSVVQLRMFGVLRDREPGMQALAQHLGLDKSSMTGLVDRAGRRGLVRRTTSPHDGRAVLVSLTEEGQRLARAGAADVGRRIEELAAALDAGQRGQLARLVSALLEGTTAL